MNATELQEMYETHLAAAVRAINPPTGHLANNVDAHAHAAIAQAIAARLAPLS